MQKIGFTSKSSGTIEIDDVNVSSVTGEKVLRLSEIDVNSLKVHTESVSCIGMPGQITLSAVPEPRTVIAKIAFAPVYLRNNRRICTGSAGMFTLRREILRRFPIGEDGTLVYTNDVGSYEITARLDELPRVTVKDGYLCECTLMFTCDYPYWCRTVTSGIYTVTNGNPASIVPEVYGDIKSPVSGIITCNETLSGLADDYVAHFRLRDSRIPGYRVTFCKALEAGEKLRFGFLYNNKWYVEKSTDGGVTWVSALKYVYFTDWALPCETDPVRQNSLVFELLESGSLDVQLEFHNLYNAI